MAGVPTYRLTCYDEQSAQRLAALAKSRGYMFLTTDGADLLILWGGPIDRLFRIGEWAASCGLAGDVEVSEFFMQGAGR